MLPWLWLKTNIEIKNHNKNRERKCDQGRQTTKTGGFGVVPPARIQVAEPLGGDQSSAFQK